MSDASPPLAGARTRRPPPPFRHVAVRRVVALTPRLTRVTFAGPDLSGMTVDDPAASIRLLLPAPGTDALIVPRWNGNEFLLPDGRRPILRTFTPGLISSEAREMDLDVVLHGDGAAAEWARSAAPGDPAAVSGPGRGYLVDPEAPRFLLAGDEAAIPAITQLLSALPPSTPVEVHIELARSDARLDLGHPGVSVQWHDLAPGSPPGDALVAALADLTVAADTRVWAAGEAASMQRIRRLLLEERQIPRAQTTIRGYWKLGRREEPTPDA